MDDQFLNKLSEILETHIENEHFGVSELAKEMGMSRSNLHRKIITASKISTNQYIRQFRLQKGLEMLKQTSFTVSEVSYKVGFSSPAYFIKCFHDYYGYPPGEVGNREERETDKEFAKSNKKRLAIILSSVVFLVLIAVILFVLVKPFSFQQIELEKTIALRPFIDDSPEEGNTHIINGLMDEILIKLENIDELEVKSRTDSEKYRKNDKSIKQMGRELNVNYILEGSGQVINNEIKLTLQLIEVNSGNHVWADNYIRDTENIFELQKDVAISVASALKATLTTKEIEQIKKRPTENLEAYQYFLRGEQYKRLAGLTGAWYNSKEFRMNILKAKSQYQRAVEMDSSFVHAYAELGNIYIYTLASTDDAVAFHHYLDSGLAMVEKAIFFANKKSDEVSISKNWAYGLKGDYFEKKGMKDSAITWYKRSDIGILKSLPEYRKYRAWAQKYNKFEDYYEAIKNAINYLNIKPENVETFWYIIQCLLDNLNNTGYSKKAEDYAKELLTLNNDSINYLCNLGIIEFSSGNFENAQKLFLKAHNIDSTNTVPLYFLKYTSVWQRKYSEAFYYLQKQEKVLKSSQTESQPDLANGFIYLKNGYNKEANIEFKKAVDYFLEQIEYNMPDAQRYYTHVYLSCIYSELNEKEKAIFYIKMFKERKTVSRLWVLVLKEFPMFDNIRNEPEFAEVLKDAEAKYQKEYDRVGKLLGELGDME